MNVLADTAIVGHLGTRPLGGLGERQASRQLKRDVHIGKLRRKVDPDGTTPLIQTARGAGYMLRAPG